MAVTHEAAIKHIQDCIEKLSYSRERVRFNFMVLEGFYKDGVISESEFKGFEVQLQQIFQEQES